jgi:hypothetical protein
LIKGEGPKAPGIEQRHDGIPGRRILGEAVEQNHGGPVRRSVIDDAEVQAAVGEGFHGTIVNQPPNGS